MITLDLKLLKLKTGNKILDAGCGTGRHIDAICSLENINVFGVDLSLNDLKLAQERMGYYYNSSEKQNLSWDLLAGNISRLPFKDNFFDLVICSEVLEHINDDKNAINELVRVLKHNKMLVITVPRYFPEKICWILSNEYIKGDQKHLRIYRKRRLINLLESYGLICCNLHYSHSLHTIFWWLKCAFNSSMDNSFFVNLYHSFLIWDLMNKPIFTQFLDKLLNPILGKSLVLYMKKK